ncbi:MAG TPA: PhoH family protein [Hyphomicrobiales bacterium]|nr:PhoH family protein [Rhodobiaceae bacterium]HXK54101.1 PhoH family protein [Hyphomicrobiales bacterium]
MRSHGRPAPDSPAGISGAAAGERVLTFEDNHLLSALLGDFDQNLALIEHRLDIEAAARGNHVFLSGPAEACAQAEDVLLSLYDRLKAGHSVGAGDVDGAIRLAAPPTGREDPGGDAAPAGSREARTGSQIVTRRRTITARSRMQDLYMRQLEKSELVFATGPAGTGKTYLAVAFAAAWIESGKADRIILSRPAVEAGERLGFLPGAMREKIDPYLRPLYDALYDVMAVERVERGLEQGSIEIAPLAFMRGRTLSNAVIILDEAQNCTSMQMKMFLTRIGENSRMIVTGDPSQVDLPPGQTSGLGEAIGLLKDIAAVAHVPFTDQDVVRHELIAKIVRAYDQAGRERSAAQAETTPPRPAADGGNGK